MVPRSVRIQDVLGVKVKVKDHVIWANMLQRLNCFSS